MIPVEVALIRTVPSDGVVTDMIVNESRSASVSLDSTSRSTSGVSNGVV